MGMRSWLIRSAMRSPYANLALEERLMRDMEVKKRETPEQTAAREATTGIKLLTYTNEASVVVGRYQNQWKECNMRRIHEAGVQFVRRQSGGGTVYHDEGCMCFSILLPKKLYDPKRSIDVVGRALRGLGATGVHAGERNDLWVGDNKICGSAFRITQSVAYHHGTLLLRSNLDALQGMLRPPAVLAGGVKDRSVGSVRSPVTLLSKEYPDVDFSEDRIAAAIYDAMVEEYGTIPAPPDAGSPDVVKSLGVADLPHQEELLELPERGTPTFTLSLDLSPNLQLGIAVARNKITDVTRCDVFHDGVEMVDFATYFEEHVAGASLRHDLLRAATMQAAYATLDSSTSPYEQEHAFDCANGVLDALDTHGL